MNEHKAIFSHGIFSKSKKFFATIVITIIASIMSDLSVYAIDLPTFYRAPLFQGTPKKDLENWTTDLTVGYYIGWGTKGWNSHGDVVDLLDTYGLMNAGHLGLNVYDQVTTFPGTNPPVPVINRPVTKAFWVNEIVDPNTGIITPPNGIMGQFYQDPTERIALSLSGEITAQQFDFTLHQNLFAGFFAQIYLPVRQVEIDTIDRKFPCTVTGQKEIEAFVCQAPIKRIDGVQTTYSGLLATQPNDCNKNVEPAAPGIPPNNTLTNIDLVLQENGLTGLREPFKRGGVGDLLLSIGWQGYDDHSFGGLIKSIEGSAQLGVLVPLAPDKDEDHLYSVPLGYNDHIGFLARVYAQIGLSNIFGIGLQTSVLTFINKSEEIRMKSDFEQSGIVVLGKGCADIDQGQVWDLGGYGIIHNFCKGLEIIFAYSFTRQEPSRLGLRDSNFLEDVYLRELNIKANPNQSIVNPVIFPRKDVVNSDQRYWGWEQHTLHGVIQYDFKVHKNLWFAPCLKLTMSGPIAGRRAYIVNMYGGSFGMSFDWSF